MIFIDLSCTIITLGGGEFMHCSTKRMFKILTTSTFIGLSLATTSIFAAENATVDLTYKTFTQLTDEQKNQVRQGTPHETIIQGLVHYTLVYDKVNEGSKPTSSSFDSLEFSSVTQLAASKDVLPSTGDSANVVPVFIGLGVLSVACWLVYRDKKIGTYLLIAVLVAGGLTTTVNGLEAVRRIGDIVTKVVTTNTVFTYQPEQIVDGYQYVGYIVVQEELPNSVTPPTSVITPSTQPSSTPQEKTGSVVVSYQLEDGTEIRASYTDTNEAPLGTAYNAAEDESEKPAEISHNGKIYVFKESRGSETGIVVEGQTQIVYIYVEKNRGRIVKRLWNLGTIFNIPSHTLLNEQDVTTDYVGNTYTVSPFEQYVTVSDVLRDKEVIITKDDPKFAEFKAAYIQKMKDGIAEATTIKDTLRFRINDSINGLYDDLTREQWVQAVWEQIQKVEQHQEDFFFIIHDAEWYGKLFYHTPSGSSKIAMASNIDVTTIDWPTHKTDYFIYISYADFLVINQGSSLLPESQVEQIMNEDSNDGFSLLLRQYSYEEVLQAIESKISTLKDSNSNSYQLRLYRELREEMSQRYSSTPTIGTIEEGITYVDYFVDIDGYVPLN